MFLPKLPRILFDLCDMYGLNMSAGTHSIFVNAGPMMRLCFLQTCVFATKIFIPHRLCGMSALTWRISEHDAQNYLARQ